MSDFGVSPIARELRRHRKAHPRFGGSLVNCLGIRRDESHARAKRMPWKRNDRMSPCHRGCGRLSQTRRRLEFGGRNVIEPNERYEIVSDIAYRASKLDYPAATVTVLSPTRTFWEKATLIYVECHRRRIANHPGRLYRPPAPETVLSPSRPSGSAPPLGRLGCGTHPALTFELDQSIGADHSSARRPSGRTPAHDPAPPPRTPTASTGAACRDGNHASLRTRLSA